MIYPKLLKKEHTPSNVLFEYDGGDLWIRENVSFWDDQDYCWENDILPYIQAADNISKFLWKIHYTMPYLNQIKGLAANQKYKIKKNNEFYSTLIDYSKNELTLIEDILLFSPKIIAKFINLLKGINKIHIGMNVMKPEAFDIEDDDWIEKDLKNPNWNTAGFYPTNADDLNDIKFIKANIDPKIKIDFSMDDEGLKILKKEGVVL